MAISQGVSTGCGAWLIGFFAWAALYQVLQFAFGPIDMFVYIGWTGAVIFTASLAFAFIQWMNKRFGMDGWNPDYKSDGRKEPYNPDGL